MSTGHRKILVADDDYSVLDRYRMILKGGDSEDEGAGADALDDFLEVLGEALEEESLVSSWDVTLVEQGLEAVHAAQLAHQQGEPFSHAFLDMRMPPGMDGLQTAVKLREMDPDIRIIFVSAYFDYTPEDIENSLGEDWLFLQKPFKEEDILKLLEQ